MKFYHFLFVLLSVSFFSFGQQTDGLTKLPISSFKLGNAWKTTEKISIHPFKADAVTVSPNAGDILEGTSGGSTSAVLERGDLLLQFDFMLSSGAKCELTLPGGTPVKLFDGALLGSLITSLPSQNVCKSPGLWQKMQLLIRKPGLTEPAKIEYLKINDVIVHENVYLQKLNDNNNLSFSVQKGTAAFKNFYYQIQNESKPLSITQLNYQLYSGWADKLELINAKNLVKKDTTSILTQEWGVGSRDFHVVYEGKINVEKTADYILALMYMGHLYLDIDGKNISNFDWSEFSQKAIDKVVNLTAGEHTFKLVYHKAWRPAALGIFVSASGVKPYPLHALASLPEPTPIPTIAVNPSGKPELIRSFIQVAGEKTKRTHALSVGFPQNIHYTIDLNQAAPLQVWKGQFANVTEMWYERGEPQLLTPLGITQNLNGKSLVALLSNANEAWPDSVANLQYKGYRLDASGTPEFSYKIADTDLKITLIPENGSFSVKIKALKPTTGLFVRMAVGQQISEIEPGLFEIDGQRYFVNTSNRPILRSNNGKQELLLSLTDAINYSLIW